MAKGYAGVSSKARAITDVYAGVYSSQPIYSETTTTKTLNLTNLSDFFSISNGSGTSGWNYENYSGSGSSSLVDFTYATYTNLFTTSGIGSSTTSWSVRDNTGGVAGIRLTPNNYGVDSTTATVTLTAKYDCVIEHLICQWRTESGWDKVTVTIGGTTHVNALSGESNYTKGNIAVSKGQQIVLQYVKDTSNSHTSELVDILIACEPYSTSSAPSSGGIKLSPKNFAVGSSTATITLTAKQALTGVSISGQHYSESRYDKFTLTAGGTSYLSDTSGAYSMYTIFSGKTISKGSTIVLKFTKDGSVNHDSESSSYFVLKCNDITVTTLTQTGTQTGDFARKVKKIYAGVSNKARLVFDSENTGGVDLSSFTYTGGYTTSSVTHGGVQKTLVTCTSSGTLTLSKSAQYWICNGGNGGSKGNVATDGSQVLSNVGGGGGHTKTGTLSATSYSIQIGVGGDGGTQSGGSTSGTAGGSTYIGSYTPSSQSDGSNGGSGGGAGSAWMPDIGIIDLDGGQGAGISTYPFGITSLKAHSAGGACGGIIYYPSGGSGTLVNGSVGGTNGGDGGDGRSGSSIQGTGGTYGGGSAGYDATFYGGGGGGGWSGGGPSTTQSPVMIDGSAGYQGVAYILI